MALISARYLGFVSVLAVGGLAISSSSLPQGSSVSSQSISSSPRVGAISTKYWPTNPAWGGNGSVDTEAVPTIPLGSYGTEIKQGSGSSYPIENLGRVLLHSGAYVYSELLSAVPCRQLPFVFSITHRSDSQIDGLLGRRWSMSLAQKIHLASASTYEFFDGEGTRTKFQIDSTTGEGIPDPGNFCKIVPNSSTALDLLERGGIRKTFVDLSGLGEVYHLEAVRDRNGNELRFEYDANHQISIARDAFGRQFKFFYYSTGRLERLVEPNGRIHQFRFDGDNDLVEIRTQSSEHTLSANPLLIPPVVKRFTYFPDGRLREVIRPKDAASTNTPVLELAYGAEVFPRVSMARVDGQSITFSYTDPSFYFPFQSIDVLDRNGNAENFQIIAGTTVVASKTEFRNRGIIPMAQDITTNLSTAPWGGLVNASIAGSSRYLRSYYDVSNPDPLASGNVLERSTIAWYGAPNASIWRMEYDSFNNVTSVTEPRAFPGGYVPILSSGHLDLSDPYVQQFTTHFSYDSQGNLVQEIRPANSVKADAFAGLPADPIVADLVVHPLSGEPLSMVRSQGGKVLSSVNYYYWPLSDYAGQNSSSVPTNDPQTPIGYLARIQSQGKGDSIPGGGTEAPIVSASFRYDKMGRVIRFADGEGHELEVSYNLHGQVVREVSPAPFFYEKTYSYDKNGNRIRSAVKLVDENGSVNPQLPELVNDYRFDRLGRLLEEKRWPEGQGDLPQIWRHFYDHNGNRILTAQPSTLDLIPNKAAIVSRVFDESDRVFSTTWGGTTAQFQQVATALGLNFSEFANSPEKATEERNYDVEGRVTRIVDGRGFETAYTYHEMGWLLSTRDRVGTRFQVEQFDELGNPIASSVRNYQGAIMQTERRRVDEIGRLVQKEADFFETLSNGLQVSLGSGVIRSQWNLDGNGNPLAYVDPRGIQAQTIYSDSGKLLWMQDALGNRTENRYDGRGLLLESNRREFSSETGAFEDFQTRFEYDSLSRRTRQIDPLGQTTEFFYDSRDLIAKRLDPLGNAVRFSYDGVGRRVETRHELREGGTGAGAFLGAIVTAYSWNSNDRLDRVTDHNGHATLYAYDALNRLVRTTYHDGNFYQFGLDANGNRISTTDPNGTVVNAFFDEENRIVDRSVAQFAPGVSQEGSWEQFPRDGLGRIIYSFSNTNGIPHTWYSFRYDSQNRLIEQNCKLLSSAIPLGIARREFDEAGNVKLLSYPGSAGVVHYNYATDSNRLESVATGSPGNVLASYEYFGKSRLSSLTFHAANASGQQTQYRTAYDYDGDRRLTSILTTASGVYPSSSVLNLEYQYDANDRRRYRLDRNEGTGDVYEHDSVNRLVREKVGVDESEIALLNPSTGTENSWALDGVENRTTEVDGSEVREYALNASGRNQYSSVSSGSTLTPFVYDKNGNLLSDQTNRYTYDFRNRLVEVRDFATNALKANYSYDGFNRRIAKVTASGTSLHYWYGNRLLMDCNASGVAQWKFVYGDRGVNDVLVGEKLAGTFDREFYLKDALGSVVKVVSNLAGNQGVKLGFSYETFGRISTWNTQGQVASLPTDHTVFGFTGQIHDAESSLVYMHNRYYDPGLGRFISQDPKGYVDGLNLYAYAGHDPGNRTDPLGLSWFGDFISNLVQDAVAVTIVAVAVLIVAAPIAAAVATATVAATLTTAAVNTIVAVSTVGTCTTAGAVGLTAWGVTAGTAVAVAATQATLFPSESAGSSASTPSQSAPTNKPPKKHGGAYLPEEPGATPPPPPPEKPPEEGSPAEPEKPKEPEAPKPEEPAAPAGEGEKPAEGQPEPGPVSPGSGEGGERPPTTGEEPPPTPENPPGWDEWDPWAGLWWILIYLGLGNDLGDPFGPTGGEGGNALQAR